MARDLFETFYFVSETSKWNFSFPFTLLFPGYWSDMVFFYKNNNSLYERMFFKYKIRLREVFEKKLCDKHFDDPVEASPTQKVDFLPFIR